MRGDKKRGNETRIEVNKAEKGNRGGRKSGGDYINYEGGGEGVERPLAVTAQTEGRGEERERIEVKRG